MKNFKEELKNLKIKNFIWLVIAGIINSFGVMLFLYPVQLLDSGISGLSMLLDQLTPAYLTISLFLVIINIPIFIFGYKKQGIIFTIYSIFTVLIYSLFSYLIKFVFKLDESLISPLAGSDLLLCAIFGGMLSGIGSGLTIRHGGALDGMEVLSVIFAKRIGISIGTFMLIFNVTLYVIAGFLFGNWILPLYSIITYFIGSKTIDFVVEGIDSSKCIMIVTSKQTEISKEIATNFSTTGTVVDAKGGYTNSNKKIIYLIINRFQVNRLKQVVLNIDKEAFISITDVSDVIRNENNL